MSDQMQMTNMLSNDDMDILLQQYTDSQWQYIPDINQNSYNQYIQIDTTQLKNLWNTWHDNMLMIPLTITSTAFTGPMSYTPYGQPLNTQITAGPTYGGAGLDVICFKSNVTSLIGRIQVNTNTGTNIIDDNSTNLINAVRPPIQHTKDWYESESSEIMFGLDDSTSNNIPLQFTYNAPAGTYPAYLTAVSYITDGIIPNAGVSATLQNNVVNHGLYKRFLEFTSQFSYNSGTQSYSGNIFLKLCDLHDFFDQMNFPLINNPWVLYFYLNFLNDQAGAVLPFAPLQCLTATASNTFSTIATVPTISIGNGSYTATQLYLKSVFFPPNIASQIAERMSQGYSKKINYISTQVLNPLNNQNILGGQSITQLVSSTIIRPLRLWALFYPTGTLSSYGSLGPQAVITTLNAMNVEVNGANYFKQTINLDQEAYNQVREVMVGYGVSNELGSLLSYRNWLKATKYYIFNLSRLQDRLNSPNDSVSLYFLFNGKSTAGSVNVDYYFLVEKLYSVRFDIGRGDVRVLTGPTA